MRATKLTKADQFCKRAAELVAGDRERTHGAKLPNHQNIADLWNAYLGVAERGDEYRLLDPITARDVALMMVLLKVARTKIGEHNPDNYVDMAGYAGVAGEICETLIRGDKMFAEISGDEGIVTVDGGLAVDPDGEIRRHF